jgi:MarR family transcriptional regulator for hemolysin
MQKYDFQESIGFIVNKTAKAFVKALDSELREKVGVTMGQWKVLVMLVDEDGLTQKDIAERLGLEGPTLIPIIDKMEKDDLVIRRVDSLDRRNNRIYRTERANSLWEGMVKSALRIREVSLKNIPQEKIDIARSVLDSIYQNLRNQFDVVSTVDGYSSNAGLAKGVKKHGVGSITTTVHNTIPTRNKI